MARETATGNVPAMARHPHPDQDPLRVVVAGAGVSGLETLVALRGIVGNRVALTLVAPEDDFTVRALEVGKPFGLGPVQRYPLREVAEDLDARFVRDALARVERDDREVHLQSGAELSYDVLVVAIGAFQHRAYDHGVCFEPGYEADEFDRVVADVRSGQARGVGIVVPAGCPWTLPAYELALRVAAEAGPDQVTLVTAEHEPLSAFGAAASERVRAELDAAGVALLAGVDASVPASTVVQLSHDAKLECDWVVHLPLLAGPNCPGIPCDQGGFIEVDDGFRVRDGDDLFAIGDATAGIYKQGGLASQQADLVAEEIAWRLGADHEPRPYRPVLRGLLPTSHGPLYLRAEPPGGARSVEVSDEPLWWPASKVAARWLTPWLAARDVEASPLPAPRRLPSGGLSWSVGS